MKAMNRFLVKCLLMVALAVTSCGCNVNKPVKGRKVGHIVKISDEGLLFSTCEIELIRGGLSDGSGVMGQVFHCTVSSPFVRDKAIAAMNENREVVIHYRARFLSPRWMSEEGIFVLDIE